MPDANLPRKMIYVLFAEEFQTAKKFDDLLVDVLNGIFNPRHEH